jgi:hypothetical protein
VASDGHEGVEVRVQGGVPLGDNLWGRLGVKGSCEPPGLCNRDNLAEALVELKGVAVGAACRAAVSDSTRMALSHEREIGIDIGFEG